MTRLATHTRFVVVVQGVISVSHFGSVPLTQNRFVNQLENCNTTTQQTKARCCAVGQWPAQLRASQLPKPCSGVVCVYWLCVATHSALVTCQLCAPHTSCDFCKTKSPRQKIYKPRTALKLLPNSGNHSNHHPLESRALTPRPPSLSSFFQRVCVREVCG